MNTSPRQQVCGKSILLTVIVAIVGLLIVAIILIRQTTHPDTPEQGSEVTAWIKLPTVEQVVEWQWNEVAPSHVWRVIETSRTQAIERLENRSILKLTNDDFKKYTGKAFREGERQQPFLVRSVFIKNSVGQFTVRHKDDVLWVRYGTLGRGKPQVVKMPLVVLLSQEPRAVLVDGEVAE